MILKALYDYYDRRVKVNSLSLPPMQMALTTFCYAIVIDENGGFKYIEPLGDVDGTQLLTFRPEERTSAPVAHCMGDNGSYVLGLKDLKPGKEIDFLKELKSNKKNHEAFREDVERIYKALPNNRYARAIYLFYQHYNVETFRRIINDPNWDDLCKSLNKNIAFRILGSIDLSVSDQEIIQYKMNSAINENEETVCLVSGKESQKPVSTTYSTFIVGAKSNAKLVSFQINSGYDSYGKKMGLNAPISEEAEFKYTTAMLKMLSKGSRNKFMVGNRTFLFWASKDDEAGKQAEEGFFNMFGATKIDDNPDQRIEQVRKVFMSIYSGSIKTSLDDKFYILGLAPNSARIAVTYWAEIPLRDFAERIKRHFDDMEITGGTKPYFGLHTMLSAVTLGGKSSDATPNLPDAVVKSIFQGLSYPFSLFSSCIRRIRAELDNKKWDDAYKKG